MAHAPIHESAIRQGTADEPDVLTQPSVLSISTDESEILAKISILAGKIKSIDLDASSIQDSIDSIQGTKPLLVYPRHDNFTDLPCIDDTKNNVWLKAAQTLRTQLARLDFDLIGKQLEDFIEQLIVVRQRLHVDLLSRTSALALRNAPKSSQGILPVELWAQIFFLCLPNDDFVKPDPRQAPLLLCQICSAWRSVATGTPLLWSTLSIRGSWRRHIWKSFLECWLKRSGNAVLYLDISIPAYMEASFDTDVVKLITSSAQRWYRLKLSLPDNLLRSMLDNNMPVLHRLEFSSIYPIANLDIQASQAPNLRTVALLTKALYPQPLSLPWQQLTSFSSQCWLNVGQHLEILRKCARLESYSMCIVHADIPPDAKPIFMYHLRHLEIIAFIGNAMGPVLNHLQLPKLTQLSFTVPSESPVYGIADWPKFYAISLVERSSCRLTKVRLKGIDISGECIQDIKKYIPSVVSIEIH
ncbi:hypothetical protein CVT25_008205 [Psilocybe cyanescens]|uniref:Uncharacterized protein n=1 Tax=Psilocybe cyanescens TaxID=93625 RepID=A0A409X9L0_PSICY|nr:hypothetical protein CVT25_008205 [Psilocybe cyanescens]